MNDILTLLISSIISIGIFFITYKQTFGARQVRVNTANNEIVSTLIRRIVNDDFNLDPSDISRLLEVKARDHNVKQDSMLSESQIFNTIYSRIIESDLINRDLREKIRSKLLMKEEAFQDDMNLESQFIDLPSKAKIRSKKILTLAFFGAIASVVGSLAALIPDIANLDTTLNSIYPFLFDSIFISAIAILVSYIIFRATRAQVEEKSGKQKSLIEHRDFEQQAIQIAKGAGYTIRYNEQSKALYDFAIEKEGKIILIEIKSWQRKMPSKIINGIITKMDEARKIEGANKAFLVVTDRAIDKNFIIKDKDLDIKSITNFRNYLYHANS